MEVAIFSFILGIAYVTIGLGIALMTQIIVKDRSPDMIQYFFITLSWPLVALIYIFVFSIVLVRKIFTGITQKIGGK